MRSKVSREYLSFLIVVTGLVLLPALIWYGLPRLQRRLIGFRDRRISEPVKRVGVVSDRIGLKKSVFFKYRSSCTSITDIVQGEFDPHPGDELAFVDCERILVTDLAGHRLKEIRFPSTPLQFNKLTRLGEGLHMMVTGEGQQCGDSAMDINGDGKPELLRWSYGGTAQLLKNDERTLIWKTPASERVIRAEFLTDPVPQSTEIIYSTLDKQLVRRNLEGHLIGQSTPDIPALNHFHLIPWPTPHSELHVMQFYQDTITILTRTGSPVITLRAPHLKSQLLNVPLRAGWVKFSQAATYFAVPSRLYNWPRTVFYLYDASGALVYQEVLQGRYAGLGILSRGADQPEAILLGGEGHVLKYEWRASH